MANANVRVARTLCNPEGANIRDYIGKLHQSKKDFITSIKGDNKLTGLVKVKVNQIEEVLENNGAATLDSARSTRIGFSTQYLGKGSPVK